MTFHDILRHMLRSTPGAIGALFLDKGGEAVELWAESVFDAGPEELRAIGAFEGIFLSDLNRAVRRFGGGRVQQLVIDFGGAKVLSCDLKEGYYLVLMVSPDANEGIAAHRLRECRDRLIAEL